MADDLFSYSNGNRYPMRPGAKVLGTSADAAASMTPKAKPLRVRILAALEGHPMTADETAAKFGVSVLACRPRFSELLALNLIADTGQTRKNISGLKASVWKAV